MRPLPLLLALCALPCAPLTAPRHPALSAQPRPAPGAYPTREAATLPPALERLNGAMRATLREAIDDERRALGAVIIYEGEALRLLRDGEEVAAFPAAPPPRYHQLKALCHLSFAAVIELRRPARPPEARRAWLERVSADARGARGELRALDLPPPLTPHAEALLDHTLALLALAADAPDAAPPAGALDAYVARARPHLDAAIAEAARAHLDALAPAGRALYALLTPAERLSARAYLYGGRGARVDNLVLQYLSWLLGEETGRESARVVFSEGVFERAPALDALARYGAERALAAQVFGDPDRLHRDVLGDAARALLSSLPAARALLGEGRP